MLETEHEREAATPRDKDENALDRHLTMSNVIGGIANDCNRFLSQIVALWPEIDDGELARMEQQLAVLESLGSPAMLEDMGAEMCFEMSMLIRRALQNRCLQLRLAKKEGLTVPPPPEQPPYYDETT